MDIKATEGEAATVEADLRELDGLPPGLLERPAHELAEALGGPALIHLPGQVEPPVFASVLLHGNETTGWEAVRTLLRDYGGRPLPRSLSLFVGNVAAAAEGERLLPGQSDFNRIWRGGAAESPLAARVWGRMAERGVFASVDVHNNTGLNPHYACINRLDHRFLRLATLFGRTVVYFTQPDSVQSRAFAELAPSVTVECGKAGDAHGIDHAARFLDAVLHLSDLPDDPVPEQDYDLYHTVATVTVREDVAFGFTEGDLVLREDLDHLNFAELPADTGFGRVRFDAAHPSEAVVARDEQGEEVAERYFWLDDAELRTRLTVMPAMLTRDPTIIRQDCLCYLMERLGPVT
ncbi:M14 family metallopeptidase [Thiohalorhabdus sp.]|uniref:M14 family metallopeptidase n=1 Tax=Thiohalorhabdus sp. TaxID=3094134 RepID=UPI002FC28900